MRESSQDFVAAVLVGDRLDDHAPEPSHALAEPRRDTAAVQGQICRAAPTRHAPTLAFLSGGAALDDGNSGPDG